MSDTENNPGTTQESTIAATSINLKLPPFWPSDPQLWFAQVEAVFATKRIRDDKTKYNYIISSLSHDYAIEIRDIIVNPPRENLYATLKEALIARTTDSEQKRLQKLINAEELGDRKPTQLLRKMEQLLGDKGLDNPLIKQLFIQRLPNNVQLILAATNESMSVGELAQLADKIMEVGSPTMNHVATVDTFSAKPSNLELEVAKLKEEIAELKKSLKKINFRHRSSSRTNIKPANTKTDSTICWYHKKFGDSATKCVNPCNFLNAKTSH